MYFLLTSIYYVTVQVTNWLGFGNEPFFSCCLLFCIYVTWMANGRCELTYIGVGLVEIGWGVLGQ